MPELEIQQKLKNLIKGWVLTALISLGWFFPDWLTNLLLSRFFNVKLELEREEGEERVTVCRYKRAAQAAFCFSIDFDLLPSVRFQNVDKIFHEATHEILRWAERYEIPMTWGICGQLAVKKQDLFEEILRSRVKHDIGAHTFSHMDLSSPTCSKDKAHQDILRGMKILEGHPVSFIFPWNRQGHLPLLRELGFIAYRGNKEAKIAQPTYTDGLWNIHQTIYLTEKSIKEASLIPKILDFAVACGGTFHMWSHPWNMCSHGQVRKFMVEVLNPILKHAIKHREEGSLWICTMRELANYSEARRNCSIVELAKEKRGEIKFNVNCSIQDRRFDFPPVVTLKVTLPEKTKAWEVYVDGNLIQPKDSLPTIEKLDRKHLLITLAFESPERKILIRTLGNSN